MLALFIGAQLLNWFASGALMSQPIFAVMAGVGASTVAQWEQGLKKPGGASARLLDVIDRKGIAAIA